MKKTIIAILQLQLITPTLLAAVPLRWTVETSRVQPAVFEAYQGETLTFEAALQSHGKPLAAPVNYSFFWQTNGMGSTYWEVKVRGEGEQRNNSTVHLDPSPTNVLFATWSPEMDVGAKVYNCFIGSPSNIYHAAFQLRLRPSPGALPNALPLPTPVIDFAQVRVLNPPWGSGGGGGGCDTNAVDILANSAAVTNALTVATTNRVAALESSKLDVTGGTVTGDLEVEKGITVHRPSNFTGKLNVNGSLSAKGVMITNGTLCVESEGYTANYKGDSWDIGFDSSYVIFDFYDWWEFNLYDGVSTNEWFVQLPRKDGTLATLADIPAISANNPTFSNEVATVARTVTPPPSPTLRLFDEVRQCYWIGRMVNGVINWEVE